MSGVRLVRSLGIYTCTKHAIVRISRRASLTEKKQRRQDFLVTSEVGSKFGAGAVHSMTTLPVTQGSTSWMVPRVEELAL